MAEAEAPEFTQAAETNMERPDSHDSTGSGEYTDSSTTPYSIKELNNPHAGKAQEDEVAPGSEVDEDDLSLFEYARYHGLTTSCFDIDPLQHVALPSPPGSLHPDLQDPQGALNIGLLVSLAALDGHTIHEKWNVDKESLSFLGSVLELGKEERMRSGSVIESALSLKDLKLEQPLLMSDPETDLLRLKRRNMVTISTDGMEPFKIDQEEGEGLSWTTKELDLLVEADQEVMNEMLDVDRETMKYLKDVSTIPQLSEHDVKQALFRQAFRRPLTPISPPLMPLDPPVLPSSVSAAAGEMEFTSTPEDLIAEEAAKLNQHILDHDITPPHQAANKLKYEGVEADAMSVYSASQSGPYDSSSPIKRKRLQELKVEVPLTPLASLEPPAKKTKRVSFPEDLHSMIPSIDSDISILDPAVARKGLDEFVADVIEPLADSALHQVENEELLEFDTTMRVPMPPIEEHELQLPWGSFEKRESASDTLVNHQAMLLQMKRELSGSEINWSGVSKIERQLPWSPFPARLGKIELDERFDDGSLARYMTELTIDDHIDIESLISRPPRYESNDDTDEEPPLEPWIIEVEEESRLASPTASPTLRAARKSPSGIHASATNDTAEQGSVRMDMQTLLKKRKLELETGYRTKAQPQQLDQSGLTQNAEAKANHALVAKPTRFSDLAHNVGGLSSFMNLHGRLLQEHSLQKQSLDTHQQVAPPAIMKTLNGDEVMNQEEQPTALSVPILMSVPKSVSIVVSSSLLTSRELSRQIQHALPAVEFVEREPIATLSASTEAKLTPSKEADLTASPSTGVVISTLQKLKQKPLPGQSAFFGIYERIALVSQRYTRLVVLVSEARRTSESDPSAAGILDNRDSEALSDLMGFAAELECDIEVYYVPGGDSELASWIAAVIAHNAPSENGALLHDETMWERYLRTAGLNAYAAQSILASLKAPEFTSGSEMSSISGISDLPAYGLAAFMQMTDNQRTKRFGHSVGVNALKRFSGIVEQGWLPNTAKSVLI